MKRIVIILLSLLSQLYAQNIITGEIKDKKGNPIIGVNVYLEGTYDGSSTNEKGVFKFSTSENGEHTLIASFMSFETKKIKADISELNNLEIILREDVESLDAVVISAGTFEANDNSKVSVLKPLDVVTTASALGDFVGALQTLPGTSNVAEDGRLFVRGGNANETQIFIDGIRVFTPYTPTTNNLPTRGRYSPFLFDGITFSTGGYSAEYGQALSSVLLLNTINEPDQNKTDIGIMSVGASLGNTQKWEKSSLSFNASYINLGPYFNTFSNRNNWETPIQALSGETVYRKHLNNGTLKFYAAFDTSKFKLTQEDINFPEGIQFGLNNNNFYMNSSYKGVLSNGWSTETGVSFTHAVNELDIEENDVENIDNSAHFKFKLKNRVSSRLKFSFGAEQFLTSFNESFKENENEFSYGYDNNITGVFLESDIILSKKIAFKIGARTDYSQIFKSNHISPRFSVAYKTSDNGQLSFAYGDFFQNPDASILKFNQDLTPEKTTHLILNYQYVNNGRIFRAEVYSKDYDNLIKYSTELPQINSNYDNEGFGYARGVDVFWRDNSSVNNLDYWISYSYLDSERNHNNFQQAAQPSFVTNHNLSVVAKYFVNDLKSQLGISYVYSSGRPYNNPNSSNFLAEKTKSFNSLSFNWAYLLSQQKIIYFSVNNILGIKNINGYQYANTQNSNGQFNRRALRPASDQFFFVGFFWTISEKGTDNQLNNL